MQERRSELAFHPFTKRQLAHLLVQNRPEAGALVIKLNGRSVALGHAAATKVLVAAESAT